VEWNKIKQDKCAEDRLYFEINIRSAMSQKDIADLTLPNNQLRMLILFQDYCKYIIRIIFICLN